MLGSCEYCKDGGGGHSDYCDNPKCKGGLTYCGKTLLDFAGKKRDTQSQSIASVLTKIL